MSNARHIETLFLATVLFAASAWAAERELAADKCSAGTNMTEGQKTSFVMGWVLAVEHADMLTKGKIVSQLWPKGHRVGSVVIEIDAVCKRAEAKDIDLGALIMWIAEEKNRSGKGAEK